jgi:hypothetical protein
MSSPERLQRRAQSSHGRRFPRIDLKRLLDTLDDHRGMLYYHLLLWRLEARGELGHPSFPQMNFEC